MLYLGQIMNDFRILEIHQRRKPDGRPDGAVILGERRDVSAVDGERIIDWVTAEVRQELVDAVELAPRWFEGDYLSAAHHTVEEAVSAFLARAHPSLYTAPSPAVAAVEVDDEDEQDDEQDDDHGPVLLPLVKSDADHSRVYLVARLIETHESRRVRLDSSLATVVGASAGAHHLVPEQVGRGISLVRTSDGFLAYEHVTGAWVPLVPESFEVEVQNPMEAGPTTATCGTCWRSWDDGKSTSWTPTPSGRCPFEYYH